MLEIQYPWSQIVMYFFKKYHLFFKYLTASALNTLFGITLLYILSLTNMRTWMIVLISNACGIIFNYNSLGKIAFNNFIRGKITIFILISFAIYIAQIEIISATMHFFNERIYAILLSVLITAIPNFYLLKKYVFEKHKDLKRL
jgi:hypothetical protein